MAKSVRITGRDLGLKVWFKPEEDVDVELDVVAVHGLGQHPDDTWVHDKGINWLQEKDMLPAALEKARIMRFGYKSAWFGEDAVRQSLADVARKLLSALKDERKKCQQRPILFIGHCLGGLVIEQAYNSAKKDPRRYPGIYDSITGIVFLGTPHHGNSQGTQAVLFGEIVKASAGDAQVNILETLAQDNDVLLEVVNDFTTDISQRQHPPKLFCFFEKKSCSVGREIAGIETQGSKEFVVGQSSGTLSGHDYMGLDLNHFEMNKFESEEDGDYKDVKREIVEMMEQAKIIMTGRTTCKEFPVEMEIVEMPEEEAKPMITGRGPSKALPPSETHGAPQGELCIIRPTSISMGH